MASSTFSTSIEQSIPMVQENGLNTTKNINFDSGSNTCALPASTTIGGSAVAALGTITSASATAFSVGLNGATNPAFNIDSSTASQADGINIKGLAAGNGAGVKVITSGTNAPLTIDAAGSGTITLGGTSTGKIIASRSVDVVSAGVIAGLGTGANGITLKNLKNSAASSLSGTQLDITIDIGGTPYYFTVYPTKA